MGMFDTVLYKCPKCGSDEELQTKSGDCILGKYPLRSIPVDIAKALDGRGEPCSSCGYEITFHYPKTIPKHVSMEVE